MYKEVWWSSGQSSCPYRVRISTGGLPTVQSERRQNALQFCKKKRRPRWAVTKIKVLAAQVRDYLDIGSERLLARMFNKETLNIFMPKLYGTYFLAVLRCRWSQKCLRSGAGAAKAIYGWSWAGAENNNFGSSTLLFVTIIIAALINNSYRYLIVLCGT